MSFSCISDIHIRDHRDSGHKLLINFLRHPAVRKSEHVFFLGDIFDHLTGEHYGYISKYEEFFKEVSNFLKRGQRVYYIEGNHDFHFERTFIKALKKFGAQDDHLNSFFYKKNEIKLQFLNSTYLFCHGDLLDMDNPAYKRWKRIYSSWPFGVFVSYILPFCAVEYVGRRAAENSRSRGKKAFNYEKVKNKYRQSFIRLTEKMNFDYLIAGHTHISDCFVHKDRTYVNLGFPVRDTQFVHWNEKDGLIRVDL